MMFIVRNNGERPALDVKMSRRTPALVNGGAALMDFFCVGDSDAARAQGANVVLVHDGWYADDTGGGVAIFGQGLYWEVRDTPFTVKEASGPAAAPAEEASAAPETVNVRRAIFGV